MKKLRHRLDAWLDKLGRRWQKLSLEKQQNYILRFFAAYLILTIAVIVKVWYDVLHYEDGMKIEHINNPVLPKKDTANQVVDSISTIFKNKLHEPE